MSIVCRLILVTFLISLAGCAPSAPERLLPVQQLVGEAYRKQAPRFAPELYDPAVSALRQAEDALDRQAEDAAEVYLNRAQRLARAALYRSEQKKQRLTEMLSGSVPDAVDAVKGKNLVFPKPLPKAKPRPVVQVKPKPKAKKQTAIVKPRPTQPIQRLRQVRVRAGESLFTIAAERKVFGDALLWPLLYQANRDQIKDPRKIYPGQELIIPRDLTEADLERARSIARESTIFPVN